MTTTYATHSEAIDAALASLVHADDRIDDDVRDVRTAIFARLAKVQPTAPVFGSTAYWYRLCAERTAEADRLRARCDALESQIADSCELWHSCTFEGPAPDGYTNWIDAVRSRLRLNWYLRRADYIPAAISNPDRQPPARGLLRWFRRA